MMNIHSEVTNNVSARDRINVLFLLFSIINVTLFQIAICHSF